MLVSLVADLEHANVREGDIAVVHALTHVTLGDYGLQTQRLSNVDNLAECVDRFEAAFAQTQHRDIAQANTRARHRVASLRNGGSALASVLKICVIIHCHAKR